MFIDKANTPTERLAARVFNGNLQLDELPLGRRYEVELAVKGLKAKAAKAVKAAKAKTKAKAKATSKKGGKKSASKK